MLYAIELSGTSRCRIKSHLHDAGEIFLVHERAAFLAGLRR